MAAIVPSSRSIVGTSGARAAFSSAASAWASSSCLPFQNTSQRRRRPSCRAASHYPRFFSDSNNNNEKSTDGRLRIAIVGGGAAGLTTALHLAPLVAAGLVRGPIDVYESTKVKKRCKAAKKNNHSSISGSRADQAGPQSYPGSGAVGRDIGVGIWSTAWLPFLKSLEAGIDAMDIKGKTTLEHFVRKEKNRQSYQTLLQDLEACGSYVGDIGYRTPNGGWLVKSELNTKGFVIGSSSKRNNYDDDPALLFVREKDLLSCLRNAVKIEQRLGTIQYRSGVKVDGIEDVHGDLGSLVLQSTTGDKERSLSPEYNLIIAADGLYSPLRSRFAGHSSTHATGTGIESSSKSKNSHKNSVEYQWEHTKGQREATQVEDREYIVFRGNAPKLEGGEEDGSGSFQTWGEERSMRFAAVPFRHETEELDDDDDEGGRYSKSQTFANSKKADEEVWFATISDPAFLEAYKAANDGAPDGNAERQKQLLLEAFGSWHKPVKTLIETTPAGEIMYEMAIAHRHNNGPVFDVARILEFEAWQEKTKAKKESREPSNGNSNEKINGRGPILVFIGDAMMTVDPVLAQGFTIAMESGASLVQSIERILVPPSKEASASSSPSSAAATICPVYRPTLLRKELTQRHHHRERRMIQLLRSTELVQRMAQPHGFGSIVATWIVRPVVKLCPEGIKKRVFDFMIRYSLGLTGGERDR